MHSSTGGAQRGVGAAGGAVESSSQSLNLANTEINHLLLVYFTQTGKVTNKHEKQ